MRYATQLCAQKGLGRGRYYSLPGRQQDWRSETRLKYKK